MIEIGNWDIYIRDNDDFNEETDYRPVKDGNKRKVWPTEIVVNDKRQRWQPEVKKIKINP